MKNIEEKLANLPPELLPYKDNILATVKPVIDIKLSPADDLPLWASKVGGKPYLPLDVEYPCDENGKPLLLLAQFNCEELPTNNQLPITGILSFFITCNYDFYGEIYNTPTLQNGFRVIYFEKIIKDETQLITDFDEIYTQAEDFENLMFPLFGELDSNDKLYNVQFKPTFTFTHQEIGYENFDFENKLFNGQDFSDDILKGNKELFHKILKNFFNASGHHLLGYPFFVQEDNRPFDKHTKDYILLFQLDSEFIGDFEILWGDAGVGNFFIHPDDLAKKDFSKVAFYWESC